MVENALLRFDLRSNPAYGNFNGWAWTTGGKSGSPGLGVRLSTEGKIYIVTVRNMTNVTVDASRQRLDEKIAELEQENWALRDELKKARDMMGRIYPDRKAVR